MDKCIDACLRKRVLSLIIVVLGCMLFGGIVGFRCGMEHMSLENNEIKYGISEQGLHVHSVVWKDYPAWREVTFSVDGSISFISERNGDITLDDLTDLDAMKEIKREHNVSTNGKDLLYYDVITYVISDGIINTTIPKVYNRNSIIDTVCNSFYFVFHEKDKDHVAGSIRLLDTEYKVWTDKEADYFDMNIDAYLSAFTLSGTYEGVRPLQEKAQKEEIVLRKEEENFLNCTIYNNSNDVWCYEAQLPHIELWYKGLWIELTSPFANNLMTAVIEPNQDKRFDIPEETIMQYPTPVDGIYRLVIYGEDGEFAASDMFDVLKEYQ